MQAMGEEPRSERASPVGSATVTDERPWYSGGVRRPDEPAPPPPAEPTLDPSALPEVEAHKSAPVRLGKLGGDSGERPAAGSASGELREETRKKAALPGSGSGSGSARIGTLAAAAGPGSPAKPADADAPATEGLAELARETGFPEALLRELDTLLARRGQVVIEGPTGTGKTHLARRFAALFAGSMDRVRFIQVHPALRYEDFMEAPGANGAGSVAGVFKSFALRAAGDPGRRYVVVLDELGRADVAATLGEAYSLLEFRSEEAVLPYSREAFSIPRNLAVLATASTTTAARSLADPSARRRFHFLQLDPSAEILRGFLARVRPEYAWVADLFGELNRRLAKDGGPAAQLGQSIFMQPGLDERELERIFQFDVRPLAERAVRDPARLAELDLAALRAAVGAPAGAPRG
ncbi:MAG TPA: AAA family ATPase, partial [Planctomycetota bacterium]|nr:AAA family ATPase [Planctomycetota bacterium]